MKKLKRSKKKKEIKFKNHIEITKYPFHIANLFLKRL